MYVSPPPPPPTRPRSAPVSVPPVPRPPAPHVRHQVDAHKQSSAQLQTDLTHAKEQLETIKKVLLQKETEVYV